MFNQDEGKIECAVGNSEICFGRARLAEIVLTLFLTSGFAAFICLWLLVLPNSNNLINHVLSIKCQDRFSFDCQNVRPSIFLSFCLSFSWRLYFSAYLYYFLSEIVRMSRNCQYRFSFLVIIVLSSCAFLYTRIAIILSFNIILSYSIVLFFYSGFHNPNY